MNNHTEGLGTLVKQLRSDTEMKVQVQQMLQRFSTNTETMCHGDLHSGSIMCTNTETKVIDPEFGFYGPMGFDLGMLIANFLMAYFSQPAHRKKDEIEDYQEWILDIIGKIFRAFRSEFATLWDKERTGILFPKKMFEDQGQSSQKGLENIFNHIGHDVIAVCGIEMHRRCLSLAHNADFELIENIKIRAKLEARNLMLGRELILNQKNLNAYRDIEKLARNYNEKDFL
jgi:5-methylthioribose kinase